MVRRERENDMSKQIEPMALAGRQAALRDVVRILERRGADKPEHPDYWQYENITAQITEFNNRETA